MHLETRYLASGVDLAEVMGAFSKVSATAYLDKLLLDLDVVEPAKQMRVGLGRQKIVKARMHTLPAEDDAGPSRL